MTPILISPPAGPVVSLPELKAHLRVDSDEEDDLIKGLERAAVAWLDGWRGVLGRCILPQKWAVSFDRAGTFSLPFPGVTEVEVDAGAASLGDGCVTITEPARVTITVEAGEDIMPSIRVIILMLVGHWYHNREAVAAPLEKLPMAVDMLLAPIRVVRT